MNRLKKIFIALTRGERILFVLASAAALLSAIAIISILIDKATVNVPTRGGDYIEGVVGQPAYANPILAVSDPDKNLVRLLFASVTDLAQKIDTDESGRLWRVRLKEGLVWSDQRKITSDDVIFTVQKMQDPETRSPHFASWQGVAVSRLSEIEFQFNLVSPYPFFGENLRDLFVIPKHLFADTPSSNWRLSDYNLKPIGSGPYAFDTYEKRADGFITSYRLKINPVYSGDQPLIENITLRFFPRSEEVVEAFNSGSVDGIADFSPEALEKINRSYDITAYPVPSYYGVFFNQGQNLALKELAVRRALDLAVDRNALVKDIFADRATTVTDPVSLGAGEQAPPPDEAAATALLESAGWQVGEDGFRTKKSKDGIIKLEFDLIVPKVSFLERTAEALKETWRRIGAQATIRIIPSKDVADRIIKREYNAILYGNFLNPAKELYPFWHSNNRFYPGLNLALYNSKRADQLMEAIRRNLSAEERARELEELKTTIKSDVPAVLLYSPNFLYITTKDLRGVTPHTVTEPADRYRDVSKWHLKTTRVLK